jgi:hypothetical protein
VTKIQERYLDKNQIIHVDQYGELKIHLSFLFSYNNIAIRSIRTFKSFTKHQTKVKVKDATREEEVEEE